MDNISKKVSNPIGVGEIIRRFGQQFREQYDISPAQQRAFFAIKNCRTMAMGGHAGRCDQCGHIQVVYNSCRNRHCPQCQGLKRAKWVEKLACDLLPVPYFHIVFTIPDQLNPIALVNQQVVYDILFKAASETITTLVKQPKYLHSDTGMVAILHTWGQNLMFHPHLHTIVPAGGWNKEQQNWHASRRKFFIPVRVVSEMFRGKFLFYLKQAFKEGLLSFSGSISGLKNSRNFNILLTELYKKGWVVFTKKSFKNSAHIINYLGRYSHRVAIANNRILSIEDGMITFTMKDYRDGKRKTLQLQATEFVRRFLLHVLPKGFCKIRYFGLFATRCRGTVLEKCRMALGKVKAISKFAEKTWQQQLEMVTGIKVDICPQCKRGQMITIVSFKPLGALA